MNISIQTLLAKIDEELKLAKSSAKPEGLREKVYSIKILCELILDEKPEVPMKQQPAPVITQPVFQQPVMAQQVFQQPASLPQAKKIEMDDEANGDSLFDF
ncbi:YwdI family protein [Neobacillus sp. MM2021_6]|uniref:YwdI family protein n=1 Tax=Bacillaceae TaxID=186817 RepID=UPI00140C3154|nr:YwdI family protein [Neobacillus sp. OS1-2]MBO0958544.1 YwdI family protein [Neobacillus sp. MM2021_6]NHC18079.1 YwdI family protein [Bacillus sp. MM2020_4]WML41697.1 YwdI family protein [Neobacillus sp. OS1-2]